MIKYDWKDDTTRMLRALRNSRTLKVKYGWSRESGAGFISEDIKDASLVGKKIRIYFNWLHQQDFDTCDLNLRETEELIKYLET